jgi:hypothetical protein
MKQITTLVGWLLGRREEQEQSPYGQPTIVPVPVDIYHQEPPMPTNPTPTDRQTQTLIVGVAVVILAAGWVWAFAASSLKIGGITFLLTIAAVLACLRLLRGGWKEARFSINDDELFAPKTPSKRVKDALGGKKGESFRAEEILWETREHPLGLWQWWIGLGVVQVVCAFVGASGSPLFALMLWVAGTSAVAVRVWMWDFTRICITSKRLLVVSGILNVTFKEMPLSKLTDKTTNFSRVSTSLAAIRVIRTEYVTLIVESAGQKQALTDVYFVPRGYELNRLVVGLQ